MDRSTISFKEMVKFKRSKKVFFKSLANNCNIDFQFFLRISLYKGEMIYEYPEPEDYFNRDPEMISTYGKKDQFKQNYSILESDGAKQFLLDHNLLLKKKYLEIRE